MRSRPFNMIASPASYRPANHVSAARSMRGQVLVMAECTTPQKVDSPKTANREAGNPTQPTSSDMGLHSKNIAWTSVKLICVLVGVGLHLAACWLAINGHGVEQDRPEPCGNIATNVGWLVTGYIVLQPLSE